MTKTIISNIDFKAIASKALANVSLILSYFLPGGERKGSEYIVCNPTRKDTKPGSFKINMRTGKWSDFAIGDAGGDLISLIAYLQKCRQSEAAQKIAKLLGIFVQEG